MKRRSGWLLLLLVGLAAGGAFLLFRPRPVPAPRVLHPTVRQAALARRHIEGLSQQLTQTSSRGPRTFKVSESDLNVYLASSQSTRRLLSSHGVHAVQVTLEEPANLILRASVDLNGHPQNVQLDGALAPDPQLGLRFTATHAQIGQFPLPAAALATQANALAARFSRQMAGRLPFTIQSVRVHNKSLLVTGIPLNRRVAASPQ